MSAITSLRAVRGPFGVVALLMLAQCGKPDDDPCTERQYSDEACDPQCKHMDRACDGDDGDGDGGGDGGGDSAASTDPCVAAQRYGNGVCEVCPHPDFDCFAQGETDPCLSPNRYGDGPCDVCRFLDADCAPTGLGDICRDEGRYNNGTCDACLLLDPDCPGLAVDPCEQGEYDDDTCDACRDFDVSCDNGFSYIPPTTGLVASDGTRSGGVELSWDPNPHARTYFIRKSSSPIDSFDRTDSTSGFVQAPGHTAVLALQDGYGLYFKIEAMGEVTHQPEWGAYDFGFSGPIQDHGRAPNPPASVTAALIWNSGQALVYWPFVADAQSYRVERRAGTDPSFSTHGTVTVADGWPGPNFLDEDLQPGVLYTYRVIALNSHGASSPSAVATAQIQGLPRPEGLVSTQVGSDVLLTWESVAGAAAYEVFRTSAIEGPYDTPLSTVSAPLTTFTDTTVPSASPGTSLYYYYKVRATGSLGVTELSLPSTLHYRHPLPLLAAPANVTIVQVTESAVALSWDAVPDASFYALASRVGSSGSFETTSPLYDTYATTSFLQPGTRYEFKLATANQDAVVGSFGAVVSVTTRLEPPPSFDVASSLDGAILTWGSVTGAASYNIYWSSSSSGTFTLLTSVTTTDYTDVPAAPHVRRYYQVAAVDGDGLESARSGDDSSQGYQQLPAPTLLAAARVNSPISLAEYADDVGLELTWEAVTDATSYAVYTATSPTATFYPLGYTVSLRWLESDLDPFQRYYFRVAAVKNNRLGVDAEVNESTSLPIPKDVQATAGEFDASTVTWDAVAGAAYYKVYRSDTNPPVVFNEVATNLTDTSFVDTEGPLDESLNGGSNFGTVYYTVEAFSGPDADIGDVGSGQSTFDHGSAKQVQLVGGVGASSDTYLTNVCSVNADCGPGFECRYISEALPPGNRCASIVVSGKIRVSWSKATGASTYRVYRKDTVSGAHAWVSDEVTPVDGGNCETVRNTCYWDDLTATGNFLLYHYYVLAAGPYGREGPIGGSSQGHLIDLPVALESPSSTGAAQRAGGGIDVTWSTVSGAASYRLYRSEESNVYMPLAIVSGASYIDLAVTAGLTYRYFLHSLTAQVQETDHFGSLSNSVQAP